ncbi:uncharacterized protein LOC131659354 [Vicia villosa]|uniref:uncharacterized protein LOC131659354 n=1 Tax=Vicia villosa TaxID=3911 RepID=UPI00273CA4B8|nr:uncharacterized protein LOC131659354 [Vicia villosa]
MSKARDNATATSSQPLETIDESSDGLYFHELFEEEQEAIIQPTVVNMAATAPCANSPRLNPQFARTAANGRTSELKTGILQLICASPFAGLDHEDPYTHLTRFYELASTTGVAQAEEETLFKRLFPHSLLSKVKDWYLDQPETVMTDWNTLEEKFLERFYSQNRFFDAKTTIAVFSQGSNESLNEAWERFKAMLRKCKGHGFAEVDKIHMFRNGLTPTNKTLLDTTAGGSLMSKITAEAIQIIERMALNDRQTNQSNTTFSANTQENPKEHCKAVVTRTGQKGGEGEVEINDTEKEDNNRAAEDEENEVIVSDMNKEAEKNIGLRRANIQSRRTNDKIASSVIPSQHLPYPHVPSKKDHARQYARFMEIFKQLQINIPFSEAIDQMPKYAKFMKDILTKKKRPEEEVVVLDAQCSAIVSRLPQKARDPGRVTLPVTIGNQHIGSGLIDLGSSINLIPL